MALIGKVVSITGTAYLITENGLRRELSLGDQVQVGDAIETSRGAEVELELANGRLVNIHSEQLVQFTEELSEVIAPSNLDSAINLATIETVIKAIEEGKDVNAVLEETAAGQSGQYNSYGFSFVDLLRVNDILNAFNFAYDYEINQRADTGPLVDGDDNTYLSLPATSTPISGQISPTNNPPIAASVIANGAEDAASIAITLSGTDVDGTIASITLNNLPANGLLYTDATLTTLVVAGSSYVGSSATFYFVPNTNFNGNANFAYTVTDNLGLSSAAGTATITVALVNDAPTVNNDNIVVTEDTPVTGNVLTNDTDVDGNPLSVTQFTVDTDGNGFPEVFVSGITATIAGVGTVVINANGGFIFTPAPDYTGLIPEIIYTLSDGVLTDTGSLNLGPITPINDAPVAMDDIATTTINTPIDIDVKANDIDIDNITAQLTVSNPILTNSVLGTVSVNPDGTLHFEPAFNVAGPVEITYTLTDPAGLSDTATLTVNVGNNTSPTGANNTVAINEDAPYIFQGIDFGFNDIDAGQSLNGVRIDALPLSGALTLNGSPISAGAVISIAQLNAGQLRFVPVGDASDSPYASFTFSVQDNAGGFDTAPNTFTLNVTPVADITNDTVTTNEGTSVIFNVITGTNGATPDTFENPARAITSVTQGVNGTVSFLANGTITYTPNPNYFGGDSFTYTVTSGGITETASVNVTVNSVDDLPVAVADSINTNEDTPVTGSLAGNDTASGDGGNVWSLTTGTTNGTVTVSAAGVYNYTPNANYFGSDSFTYSITDADGDVSTATVTINVAGTNDAAVITGTSIGSVTEASGVANAIAGTPTATGTLISTDIDNPATFTAVSTTTSTGGYGTYQMTAGGVWTYTINNSNAAVQALNTGGTLTDTFTVASIDGTAKVVTVTLHGANDAAVITGTSTGSVTEASGVANAIVGTPTATGTLTDTDVDNPVNTFTAVAAGAPSTNGYGTYAMTAGGIWTYTLNNNNSTIQALNVGGTLSDTFTVTSVDGTPRLVTVTINGTNDTPIGVVESFVVTEGTTAILGNVLANDTDVDSSSLSVGQFAINASGTGAQAANGTNFITTALGGIVVMNANGTFTYTAPTSRNHSDATPDIDSFVYRASDGTATSDWTTVSINLADTGPVAYSDTASLSGGGSISGNVITGTGNIVVGGADTLGADAVSITNVTVTQGTVVSNTVGAGNVRTIVTTNGTLVIDQDDGSYTYTKATDKSVAAGTNAATQAVWTAAGFNTYGYDTPVAAGIYNSPFVGGSPANGINFTSMTATQAGYVRYRNNGGTGDDGLGVESVAGTSANNKIENNEHLLIDIGLSSQSATITLTDLTLLETATWRAYAADGSFISGATGTVNGVLSGVVSATITTMSPFAYLVVSSTGNAFRIDGLTVTPVAMTTSNIFTYTLTDADGSTSSATLTINPGIAPVIDLDASGVGNGFATAFTQGGAAVSIADTDISITDADSANITKATITLTNAQAGDVLTAGTLPGGITVSIVGNVVTLTGSTTLANYQTAIRAITFSTTSTNTASRSIDVVVTDGVNNSNTATTTVAVSLLNAPVIDLDLSGAGTGFATTYTENGVAVSIADTDISITDVDSTNMTGATITLTNAQAGDVLSAGILPGGISSSVIGNVVTLSGVSSLANYQAAIRAITFANSTENPNVTPRVISVVVTDGISNSNTATTTIAVTAVNDAPVNTVPGVQVTAEDTSKAIIGLSVSDVDAGSSMTVTLSVTNGTLTVTGGSATITGSGTGTVTLTGTVAAINATLASNVTYLSAPNYYGNDTLTMTTSDNGNTGTGGALIDVDTVNITITSVTDAPQIIMPASLSSVHAGTPTAAINTTTAITQANIETALGLPAGSLDNRFDPPTGGANDPGAVDVFDGAYTNYAITLAAGTQVAFDWSFFNGELVLSEINNGYNDVAVLVITDPNGVVNYQLLSSSEQTGINVNGATVDATGTVNYTPAITGQYQFSWLVLNAIDGNNDSQLSVGAPKTFYNGNSYGAPITFPINVLPVGDETIGLITISGLPLSGIGFSFIGSNGVAVGTNLGGGSWSFTESQLSSLQLLTPPDYVGTINLTVSAIGTENGIDATATQNISIEVAATTVNVMGTQTGNTLTGSAANDLIDGLGGNDTIDGGSGNDILSGGAGNDNLSGGIGNDLLMGGAGSDTLNGGAGNDTLIGGAGNDTMTGGLGMDVFKWELADKGAVGTPAADIVTDFDVATRVAGGDVLDLRDILTGENHTTGTGNLTNYLHFEKSGANTIVHISDSGAYAGGFNSASDVQIITLQGVDLVTGFANDQAIIQQLLTQQKLITD